MSTQIIPPTTTTTTGGDGGPAEPSLGELVARATGDISTLLRKEVELAKVELKREAVSAGKGAGALGVAGFCGIVALVFLSIALAYALGEIVPLGTGFLIVGLLYLVAAAVAALIGRKNLKKVGPPERTIETVKDDIAFAKSPTSTTAAALSDRA